MVDIKAGDFIFVEFDELDSNNSDSTDGIYEVHEIDEDGDTFSSYPISLYKYNAPINHVGDRKSTDACNHSEVIAVIQKTKLIELVFS